MNRVEYIRQLEFSLSGKLPKREISEILRDYSEYFEAGKSEGKTEEEIAVNLGIPSAVAAQILSEIEEEAGDRKKVNRPDSEPSEGGYFWENAWEKLKTFFEQLSEFFSRLFGGISPEAKSPKAPEPQPRKQPEDQAPEIEEPKNNYSPPREPKFTEPPKPPKPSKPSREPGTGAAHFFASTLLVILLFPVIVLALLAGGALLALICFSIIGLTVFLAFLFLFFLAAAFAGSLAFSVLGGLGLPISFTFLFIIAVFFCIAGSVLSICGLIYLVKGLVRLIRTCFGSLRWTNTARNPSYRASTRAANVYQDGWDAPTPPPSPAAETPPEEAGYPAPRPYEEIYNEPVPEPRLQFGNEEEPREENGHA